MDVAGIREMEEQEKVVLQGKCRRASRKFQVLEPAWV